MLKAAILLLSFALASPAQTVYVFRDRTFHIHPDRLPPTYPMGHFQQSCPDITSDWHFIRAYPNRTQAQNAHPNLHLCDKCRPPAR